MSKGGFVLPGHPRRACKEQTGQRWLFRQFRPTELA
jgi:hypothetical protein